MFNIPKNSFLLYFCLKIVLIFTLLFYIAGKQCYADDKTQGQVLPIKNSSDDYTVVCFYFPNYHVDPRNEKVHGKNWTEWELVKNAKPRFEGHQQPKVPLWGYVDEADPKVMSMKIDTAAKHGIDVFLFDWYWYNDGPFLQRCLEEGYLKAPNHEQVRFAIMWADHTWLNIHPISLEKVQSPDVLYPGEVTFETFERMTDHIVDKYFSDPAYWTIQGKPFFSIYEIHTFVDGIGGLEMAKKALDNFQVKAIKKGLPGVHINMINMNGCIPKCVQGKMSLPELIKYLKIDTVTSYVWVHDVGLDKFPETPYTELASKIEKIWDERVNQFGVPYFPNVTMGWDSSPRCQQDDPFEPKGYPFTPIISGNTPEQFQSALEKCRDFLDKNPTCNKMLTINAWNEWTEGSYLEPDTQHGLAYLEAIKNIFGKAGK